ncbi:MAG: caspase family protein [Magnetococcales bacterium]|nr:caspase family protein [Magnetococcales bacterium]
MKITHHNPSILSGTSKRKKRWPLLLLVPALLTACNTLQETTQVGRSGSSFMKAQWLPLDTFGSEISILNEQEGEIRRLSKKIHAEKGFLAEARQLAIGGTLYYERKQKVNAKEIHPAKEELLKRYNNDSRLKQLGILIAPDQIRQIPQANGELSFATTENDKYRCSVFFKYSNRSLLQPEEGKRGSYQAISGLSCATKSGNRAASLEENLLSLTQRVLFDGGEQARSRLFARAIRNLEKDNRGPEIVVPVMVRTDQNHVLVKGEVVDESIVRWIKVGNQEIPFNADGTFEADIPFSGLETTVLIQSSDEHGNIAQKPIRIVRGEKQKSKEPSRLFALLIGVSDYQLPIPSLDTPINDVLTLEEILNGGYRAKVIVLTNKDASRDGILQALDQIKTLAKDNDDVLIYYGGHGVKLESNGLGYWIPSDGTADSEQQWISNLELNDKIRQYHARRVMVIADACFSGTLVKQDDQFQLNNNQGSALFLGDLKERSLQNKRVRIAFSSGGVEPVQDSSSGGEHSVFARNLIDVLYTYQQDRDTVLGVEIFQMVTDLVQAEAVQEPQYGSIRVAGHEEGDFLFGQK